MICRQWWNYWQFIRLVIHNETNQFVVVCHSSQFILQTNFETNLEIELIRENQSIPKPESNVIDKGQLLSKPLRFNNDRWRRFTFSKGWFVEISTKPSGYQNRISLPMNMNHVDRSLILCQRVKQYPIGRLHICYQHWLWTLVEISICFWLLLILKSHIYTLVVQSHATVLLWRHFPCLNCCNTIAATQSHFSLKFIHYRPDLCQQYFLRGLISTAHGK